MGRSLFQHFFTHLVLTEKPVLTSLIDVIVRDSGHATLISPDIALFTICFDSVDWLQVLKKTYTQQGFGLHPESNSKLKWLKPLMITELLNSIIFVIWTVSGSLINTKFRKAYTFLCCEDDR